MAGSGIWLDDATYLQQQGQIWAQQHVQQLQAGQDWAQQAMASTMRQLQSMVPAVSAPAAPQPAAPPSPPPVAQPAPTPTPVPAPVAVQPAPPVTPTPAIGTIPGAPQAPVPQAPTPSSDMTQAGQNWAQEQIDKLLNPSTTQPAQTPPPTEAVSPTTPAPPAPVSPPSAISGPQSSTPGDLIDQTRQAASAAGIDPDIFARQINQESGFNPGAVSPAGARGIAQFMPDTARGLGINPDDVAQALPAAANLMKSYLDKYGGDWGKALAAYNAGPGNVDQYGGVPPFGETQNYVKTILGGAQNVVQKAAETGQTAVNTAVQGVQSAVARTSQFGLGLSSG